MTSSSHSRSEAAPAKGRPRSRRSRRGVLGGVLVDLAEVVAGAVLGPLLPGEDADRGNAVEADLGQGLEEQVPVDLALADVEVLVDAGLRAGRVDDVAQAR